MRKISAHLILDGRDRCYPKGILTLEDDGTILDIEDTGGVLHESAEVEFFSGILVPGFVNAHCHLELSHLEGAFPEGMGMVPFLKKVVEGRDAELSVIWKAAERADLLMHKNGIVAVGDISNGTNSFEIKRDSKIKYHTFIEALGFSPDRAAKAFGWAKNCLEVGQNLGLTSSIVPHSPYSVSETLFRAIAAEAKEKGSILSIHSQESTGEDELYRSGTGEMIGHLRNNLSIETTFFQPTGKNSIESILGYLPSQNNLLLIHNLYTDQADIDFIKSAREPGKTWFALCPLSNLYIQNKLPDIDLLRNNALKICLGTDSLVSNHQLSILEEMKIIQNACPEITLGELTTWATYNGANALNMVDWAGSIEVGKHPGINLLTGMDMGLEKLLPGTRVRKIC